MLVPFRLLLGRFLLVTILLVAILFAVFLLAFPLVLLLLFQRFLFSAFCLSSPFPLSSLLFLFASFPSLLLLFFLSALLRLGVCDELVALPFLLLSLLLLPRLGLARWRPTAIRLLLLFHIARDLGEKVVLGHRLLLLHHGLLPFAAEETEPLGRRHPRRLGFVLLLDSRGRRRRRRRRGLTVVVEPPIDFEHRRRPAHHWRLDHVQSALERRLQLLEHGALAVRAAPAVLSFRYLWRRLGWSTTFVLGRARAVVLAFIAC